MKTTRSIRAQPKTVIMSLSSLRIAHGMSQTDVAKALGISPTVVSKRERSGTHIGVSSLRDYARALGDRCEIVFVSKLGHRIVIDLGDETGT
jgi:transcriptional regulator with XRE-family HTH domain